MWPSAPLQYPRRSVWAWQGDATADTSERAIASAAETGKAFSAVTKEVTPAVVFIKAVKQHVMTGNVPDMNAFQGQIPDEMLRRFFGDRMPEFPIPRQGPTDGGTRGPDS